MSVNEPFVLVYHERQRGVIVVFAIRSATVEGAILVGNINCSGASDAPCFRASWEQVHALSTLDGEKSGFEVGDLRAFGGEEPLARAQPRDLVLVKTLVIVIDGDKPLLREPFERQ